MGMLALSALLLLALLGILADAYYQSDKAYDQLQVAIPSLRRASNALAKGQLPRGDPFNRAEEAVRRAAHTVNDARLTFKLAGAIPFFGRPVHAIRHGVTAARDVTSAAFAMRRAATDLLGGAARTPGAVRASDTPLYRGGVVNVGLLDGLGPRLDQVVAHLRAAQRQIRAIRPVAFLPQVGRVREQAVAETARAIRLAERIRTGATVLGSFLGGEGKRTYLVALQNQTDLRGTGGAPLAYAIVTADDGRLELETGGSVLDLRVPRKSPWTPILRIDVPMPPAVSWYVDHVPRAYPWLATANFSPDFPAAAVTWARMVEAATGVRVDGVVAMDQVAVARALGARKVRVPGYPRPISGSNLVRVVTRDQYFLPAAQQRAFPGLLVAAAWPKMLDPVSLQSSLQSFGRSLGERRIQLWMARRDDQRALRELGWDGSLRVARGDYLYVVDDKIIVNKVDYYSQASIDYDVRIDAGGNARSILQVTLENESPDGLSRFISPARTDGYALNRALLLAYVPERARLASGSPERGLPDHFEGGAKVFARILDVPVGETDTMRLEYTTAGVIHSRGGNRVYRLVIQHQPRLNPTRLTVRVHLPAGAKPRGLPRGWRVRGGVLVFETDLVHDQAYEISF